MLKKNKKIKYQKPKIVINKININLFYIDEIDHSFLANVCECNYGIPSGACSIPSSCDTCHC